MVKLPFDKLRANGWWLVFCVCGEWAPIVVNAPFDRLRANGWRLVFSACDERAPIVVNAPFDKLRANGWWLVFSVCGELAPFVVSCIPVRGEPVEPPVQSGLNRLYTQFDANGFE